MHLKEWTLLKWLKLKGLGSVFSQHQVLNDCKYENSNDGALVLWFIIFLYKGGCYWIFSVVTPSLGCVTLRFVDRGSLWPAPKIYIRSTAQFETGKILVMLGTHHPKDSFSSATDMIFKLRKYTINSLTKLPSACWQTLLYTITENVVCTHKDGVSHFPGALPIWPFKLHSPHSTKYIGNCISYCLAFIWSWLKKTDKNKNWHCQCHVSALSIIFTTFYFGLDFPHSVTSTEEPSIRSLNLSYIVFNPITSTTMDATHWHHCDFMRDLLKLLSQLSDLVGLTRTGNCVVPFNDWWALYQWRWHEWFQSNRLAVSL